MSAWGIRSCHRIVATVGSPPAGPVLKAFQTADSGMPEGPDVRSRITREQRPKEANPKMISLRTAAR
ncbi:hypothetical protein D9M70_563800 [compost metagenome]